MIKYLLSIGAIISTLAFCTTSVEELDPSELYREYCSSCHGNNLKSFVDRRWKYGSSAEEVFKAIKKGYPEDGMPSYEDQFSDTEIKELTDFILTNIQGKSRYDFDSNFDDKNTFTYGNITLGLELVTDHPNIPWGIATLPDGSILVTDRDGDLYYVNNGKTTQIQNVPEVKASGQGGLMDVIVDPDFNINQRIFLSYSKKNPAGEGQTTAIYSAVMDGQSLINGKDIYVALPFYKTRHHYGSRMVIDDNKHLFFSVGDRGKRDINPQDLSKGSGKIHRIHLDGTIPKDNPFVDTQGAIPSIWSYGHRNPQGLVIDDQGRLWSNEHGPKGGDEINLIKKGKNYGWPVISYGINYNGTSFTDITAAPGMEQPVHYWVPSIGVCGMAFLPDGKYGSLSPGILSGSLSFQYLELAKIYDKTVDVAHLMFEKIGRLRSIHVDRNGQLYIGVEGPGRVYKVVEK